MSEIQKPDMTLPEIKVTYEQKYDGTTGEPVFNKDGRQLYFIKITGLSDFKFTEKAFEEFKILKSTYGKLVQEKNGSITYQDLKLLKLHVELWVREKIDEGSIWRPRKEKQNKEENRQTEKDSNKKQNPKTKRPKQNKKNDEQRNERKDQTST